MHRINGEIVVAEINHRDRIALLSGSSEGAALGLGAEGVGITLLK